MTTQQLIPVNLPIILRYLLRLSPKQRADFFAQMQQCSEQIDADRAQMLSIIEDPSATEQERERAWHTLLDQFHLLPDHESRYGLDLVASEADASERFPVLAAEVARMDSQEEQFADRLRRLMNERHITQVELARRIDCRQPAVSQMLARRCRPQRKTLEKIATALSVDIRELWPDIEVVECLDAVAAAQADDHVMSDEVARALRDTSQPKSTKRGRALRSRREPPRADV